MQRGGQRGGIMVPSRFSSSSSTAPSSAPLTVIIQYCGGWGYKSNFDRLAFTLEDKFGGLIEIKPKQDQGSTGNFEVSIGRDPKSMKLVHSKANGKGRVGKCDSDAELDNVLNSIEMVFHEERHDALKKAEKKVSPSPPQQARRRW